MPTANSISSRPGSAAGEAPPEANESGQTSCSERGGSYAAVGGTFGATYGLLFGPGAIGAGAIGALIGYGIGCVSGALDFRAAHLASGNQPSPEKTPTNSAVDTTAKSHEDDLYDVEAATGTDSKISPVEFDVEARAAGLFEQIGQRISYRHLPNQVQIVDNEIGKTIALAVQSGKERELAAAYDKLYLEHQLKYAERNETPPGITVTSAAALNSDFAKSKLDTLIFDPSRLNQLLQEANARDSQMRAEIEAARSVASDKSVTRRY